MSRVFFLSLTALACGILTISAFAEDAPANSQFSLKSRSSFTAGEDARPPFWPIGHVKANRNSAAPVAPVPTMKLDPGMFSVTSIVLGNPSLAVINGRAYGEGEFLRPPRPSAGGKTPAGAGGKTAANSKPASLTVTSKSGKVSALDPGIRIRVIRIVDGLVTLQSMDGQSVTVPLRRPELNEPRPEVEEQLLQDY